MSSSRSVRAAAGSRRDGPVAFAEVLEEAHRDRRRHEGIAGGSGAHGFDEQRRPGVLEQEPAGPIADRRVDVLVVVERRHDDDRYRLVDVPTGQHAGDFETVEPGHADVDEAHVRPEPAGQFDRFSAVAGLADDIDAVGLEDQADARTDDLLVVGDDDT